MNTNFPLRLRGTGLFAIAMVLLLRAFGIFQPLEWKLMDYLMRWRPAEARDERITIVAIDDVDIQRLGNYPVEDGQLAEILQTIEQYEPRVIGLDIFRDLPTGQGDEALQSFFQTHDHVIAVEKILNQSVAPPPGLPPEQIGFSDVLLDGDGFIRRCLLGAANQQEEYRFSFVLRLAEQYLEAEGYELENGIKNPWAMRFGEIELPPFQASDGAYVRADAAGEQILLNFRSGLKPFRMVSLTDLMIGKVNPDDFRDRVVLLGVTAISVKDIVNSSVLRGYNPGLVPGVVIQAHGTSQILSAVLDHRSLLSVWPNIIEYSWIILWGLLGLRLRQFSRSPSQQILMAFTASLLLVALAYGLLTLGYWIPLLPPLLTFGFNSLVLYAFHVYIQGMQTRIQTQQQVIDRTYDDIHNGPLQRLAFLLRQTESQQLSMAEVTEQLHQLNQELRQVYESIRQDAQSGAATLYLDCNQQLELDTPLHELLYVVYDRTLARDFPCFAGIKAKIVKFEPMGEQSLTQEQKRGLCRFLEESLCNVGKYAQSATRLTVVCAQQGDRNLIQVQDNGQSLISEAIASGLTATTATTKAQGQGTRQAKALARQLGGTFQRIPRSSKGIHCELNWPTRTKSSLRLSRWLTKGSRRSKFRASSEQRDRVT